MRRKRLVKLGLGVLALAAATAIGAGLKTWRDQRAATDDLQRRVASVQPVRTGSEGCDQWLDGRMPLVVVVMGQSNAGNHGVARTADLPPPMAVLHNGRCVITQDPLPGGTGAGASVWSALNARLQGRWADRPIVWSVIGVEGTSLSDWTTDGSPLRRHWERQVDATVGTGWPIVAVLWQQGEADARDGTSTEDYVHALRRLRVLSEARGLPGPWWLAMSTYCPPAEGAEVREAVRSLVEDELSGFRAGPDTDQVGADQRVGCHFTTQGVDHAAALWQQALQLR